MRLSLSAGFLVASSLLLASTSRAQTSLPTVAQPLPAVSAVLGQTNPTVDLQGKFTVNGVVNQVVQFDTVLGKFNVELLPEAAPATVANFLKYVDRSAYAGSFFHRSVPNFVIQGGGFTLVNNTVTAIPADPAIALEYNLANARGTIAMARGSAAASATTQWFINTVDNTTSLGPSTTSAGYAAFGRVLGTGMTVADAIAALTVYNASALLGSTFGELPLRGPSLAQENLATVNSIKRANLLPDGSATPAVLAFSVTSSNPAVATAAVAGRTLSVTPVATGVTTLTTRATDTNGNFVENTTTAVVSPPLYVAEQPQSQHLVAGGSTTLRVAAVASASGGTIRWFHNGTEIAGATGTTLALTNIQPAQAGVYMAAVTGPAGTAYSQPAVVGVEPATGARYAGAVTTRDEWQGIRHPNGNVYDQFLLTGAAGTIRTADGKIARISLLDERGSIVQFEMSGPGALTVVLANSSGPKAPALYNQPGIEYMQGAPLVVLTGADATTHMSIYSVGRNTNPGVTRADVTYHEWANVRAAGIHSTTGGLGGLYYGNVTFGADAGPVGIAAPSVRTVGTLNFHELASTAAGRPMILLAADGQANVKITGGSLSQANGQPIAVAGLDTVRMVAGQGSSGQAAPAQAIQGRLVFEGADITADLIVAP